MLKSQKHLFSLKDDVHYFNCGYKAPLLKSAEQATLKAIDRERNPFELKASDFFSESNQVRDLFGRLVNCEPKQIAIIPSTSYGLSTALKNIIPKTVQHAITIESEFPSGYFALESWCNKHQTKLKIIKPNSLASSIGEDFNNKIVETISDDTVLVLISSIHWMNGIKFDLERIGKKCKSVGAKFIVDGTQSVGALPIDIDKFNIDALICSGYKWLLGPYSYSLAYFGTPFNHGTPIEESWMNRSNATDFSKLSEYDRNYNFGASRYNVGQTSNFILTPIMKSSLTQLLDWGIENIQIYCKNLCHPLYEYLENNNIKLDQEKYRAHHLFDLKLPTDVDPELLKSNLEQNNIFLSFRGSSLRVSVNVFNTENDIQSLIKTIEASKTLH